MSEYTDHEIANIFPLINSDELHELAADIEAHGLREPIWLHEGKILDGRNRYRACAIAQVEPAYREFDGADPIGFVVSLNLHRRHLNESARSVVAAKVENLERGNPNFNHANLRNSQAQISRAQAAEMMNVSERSVNAAKKVIKKAAPEIVEKVESGEVKISTAEKVADLPTDEQQQLAELGAQAIKEAAAKIRKQEERRREKEREQAEFEAEIIRENEENDRKRAMNPPEPVDPEYIEMCRKINKLDWYLANLIERPGIQAFKDFIPGLREVDYSSLKPWKKQQLQDPQAVIELCDTFTAIGEIYREFQATEK